MTILIMTDHSHHMHAVPWSVITHDSLLVDYISSLIQGFHKAVLGRMLVKLTSKASSVVLSSWQRLRRTSFLTPLLKLLSKATPSSPTRTGRMTAALLRLCLLCTSTHTLRMLHIAFGESHPFCTTLHSDVGGQGAVMSIALSQRMSHLAQFNAHLTVTLVCLMLLYSIACRPYIVTYSHADLY